MKEIKFDKKENGNQLVVDVKLPQRVWANEPVVEFSNSDMINYLNECGVKLEEYDLTSQTRDTLTSYSDKANKPRLDGTWVFTKKEIPEVKKVNKKPTRSYNKSKEKNTGD